MSCTANGPQLQWIQDNITVISYSNVVNSRDLLSPKMDFMTLLTSDDGNGVRQSLCFMDPQPQNTTFQVTIECGDGTDRTPVTFTIKGKDFALTHDTH